MENASKALIIAGSILIAILLIAVGVRTLNSTSETMDTQEQTINTSTVEMFNKKFTKYFGSKQSLSDVKALANEIISNNAANPNHIVELRIVNCPPNNGIFTDAAEITSKVSNLTQKKFRIIANSTSYGSDGYLIRIFVGRAS